MTVITIIVVVEVILQSRRYHVHIICVAHEQPLILDGLAVFFQSRAFLTYDISPRLPQASLYGRQCIDSCDHTVVIVGDSYGTTQNLGVSQMHLSYLSAKAKLKPMLIFIKSQSHDIDTGRQLHDFTRLVEQQVEDVYYYDDNTNIDELLKTAYNNVAAKWNLRPSWVKADDIKEPLIQSNLTQQGSTLETGTPTDVIRKSYNPTDNLISPPTESDDVTDNVTQSINLLEKFDMKYSAQAYEGGNLSDITMTTSLTWEQVLHALVRMPGAFSSHGLQGCLNRLIAVKADKDIKKKMPNVHAVSRCQIAQDDLNKLQNLLIAANWIQLTASGARTSQELWKLTFYAKKLFEENQQ